MPDVPTSITPAQYADECRVVRGAANPTRMDVPTWIWMARTNQTPFEARQSLGLESNYDRVNEPEWCFSRFGKATLDLPDGRTLHIAGEHEDFYDPEFCVYNDVIVWKGDDIEIYGYDPGIFPPTDFHTATLVGERVYLIGSIGYKGTRGEHAPVYVLDTNTYRIEKLEASGDDPGWVSSHTARHSEDGDSIVIADGRICSNDDSQGPPSLLDEFALDIKSRVWSRLTDRHEWREFEICYKHDLTDHSRLLAEKQLEEYIAIHQPEMAWYDGAVLEDVGYQYTPFPDTGDDDHDAEEGQAASNRIHVVDVDGVPVRCWDDYNAVRVIICGSLPGATVHVLIERIAKLTKGTHRTVTGVNELTLKR